MAQASELLGIARREVGTRESPSGSNRVKYNTAYYGQAVSGDAYPWCAVFAWWCCREAGVALPVKTASCGALLRAAKAAGLWVTANYRPGDIVVYDWGGDGAADHCGLVTEVRPDGTLVAIEGNTALGNDSNGGMVLERVRKTAQVLGALRPRYQAEVDNTPAPYAKEAVDWAVRQGILTGDAQGDWMLGQPITRQQAVVLLHRFAKLAGLV